MELELPSGKNADIKLAPFSEAIALKNSIASELSRTNMNFNIDVKKLKKLDFTKDMDVMEAIAPFMSALAGPFLAVESSPSVNAALMKCLARCTYDGEKITEKTFEDEGARGDYYPLIVACAKANILPFFKSLPSMLKPLAAEKSFPSQK